MTMGFGEIACSKRGIMSEEGSCGAFCYEPTKRKPEYSKAPVALKVSEDELSI